MESDSTRCVTVGVRLVGTVTPTGPLFSFLDDFHEMNGFFHHAVPALQPAHLVLNPLKSQLLKSLL